MTGPSRLPTRTDVVIVGAGSAGCVLSERLSRDPGRTVLLVERGPARWPGADTRDLRTLPIAPGSEFATHHPEASGLSVIRGGGLGGSSIVNGGYFLRRHRSDFDDWLTGWDHHDVERSFDELDGGAGGGGTMHVSAIADEQLGDIERAFEQYWARSLPVRPPSDPWPIVGVNRVRVNRIGDQRMTAAEAYLRPAADRANLTVRTATSVDGLLVSGRDVTGIRIGTESVRCDEVILCAGTLGTAAILLSSGMDATVPEAEFACREHREILVGYQAVTVPAPGALLQTVVHSADGFEIRCYRDDFASYVPGMAPTSQMIGVAAMQPGSSGTLRMRDGRLQVALAPLTSDVAERMSGHVDAVVEMLTSPDFADLVVANSVRADPMVRTSQHAWGTMPMGNRTDWLGGVYGTRGLRIVDGSILPTDGSSGPHATTMMLACRIGDQLLAR